MTKFISLVEQKDADGFRTAVEAALAEKVADVLDGLKPVIAQRFFSSIGEDAQGAESGDMSDKTCNISNEGEPAPGKGQTTDVKGGLSNVQGGAKAMPGTSLTSGPKMPGRDNAATAPATLAGK